ncbi:hypothetical protein PP182_04300 [Maribacter sp. PR1]|uniref:CFI-box-CTERM domain-containing protein n=1 Tax=Maribacter cobaltidurans TaxID=1178778 RepID=A0ABU7IQP9_9FLAO|nr:MULTISPECIES: CFI-box-CTERM domain-containing protein [Maribacter]MDC6387886.1 hypothetical protein [Maribacter sp. PR1]MEE1975275.1 CFI-box-CTERM domain-containing protein [Maribacter cobaltidurans]
MNIQLPNMGKRRSQIIVLLIVFCSVTSHATLAKTLEESLGDVIKKVQEMYDRGEPNTVIAAYITETVDNHITSTNNDELFENPLNWFKLLGQRNLNTDLESEAYNDVANVAWSNGLGNCEENSALVYYILKKAGVKENVRIMRTERHSFTVWDIHPSAIIDKPSTWGNNALVVDPWLGRTTTREEVETGRWFMNNEPESKLNDFTTFTDPEANSWNIINAQYNRENNITPRPARDVDSDEDCFIATAVYGDPNAENIQVLRVFRDKVLEKNVFGKVFVGTYEKIGPVFAFYIRNDYQRKEWVKRNIVEPAVRLAEKHN